MIPSTKRTRGMWLAVLKTVTAVGVFTLTLGCSLIPGPWLSRSKPGATAALKEIMPPAEIKEKASTNSADGCTTEMMAMRPEYRALWITRFEWPDKDPDLCRKKILQILDDMKSANFNVAVFQIRGAAETLYPSNLEPWSHLFDYQSPGFDPVAFAIEEAHKRGIEFHAYINPIPMIEANQDALPPPHTTPEHIYHLHGPDSPDPWVCMGEDGRPMNPRGAGYYYFSPNIPDVQAYLRRVIMDAVLRYPFDGVHLDRIRFPGPQYSHDPVSRRRFLERGNPNRLEWEDWEREQLNKFINDLRAEIASERPNIVFSVAAWGIYNRYHIEGYYNFSSGYHDYYQDSWEWVRLGAMDVLFPMIYWNMAEPKPNYHELLDDFIRNIGPERIVGGQRTYGGDTPLAENLAQIQYTRNVGGLGTCLFSYGAVKRNGGFEILKNTLYKHPVPVPRLTWKEHPETGIVMGRVLDEKMNPVTDAWVSLEPVEQAGAQQRNRAPVFRQKWASGADGRFAFNAVPPGMVRLVAEYQGAGRIVSKDISIEAGKTTMADLQIVGAGAARNGVFFHVFSPEDGSETSNEVVHLLGRTHPENLIKINDKIAEVYRTGAFARDNIKLEMGKNEIVITAYSPDGRVTSRTLTITRVPPPTERERPARRRPEPAYQQISPTRVAEIKEDNAGITWGLHDVRLGGPYLAEAPVGTQVEVIGEQGRFVHIRLAADTTGWVTSDSLRLLPAGTAVPHAYFTSCSVTAEEPYDIVSVSLNSPVLITATCETFPRNCINLDFYNTHWAATWISHKSPARVIGPVSGGQLADGHVRLTVPIHTKQIWGYWLKRDGNSVKLYVKRPPHLSDDPARPFEGLYIAVEAGHGGSNSGATGTMGTREKTVNRRATDALARRLEELGATVIQTRIGDEAVSLQTRAQRAIEAEADLFVSMHSNAGSGGRGFLRISGTSTYYKHPHSQLAASLVYEELLKLGWGEFGVVGNFNYYPLRMTHMPAILVEQAFMDNPFDEARLTDPEYHRQQADAIARGLARFLQMVKE